MGVYHKGIQFKYDNMILMPKKLCTPIRIKRIRQSAGEKDFDLEKVSHSLYFFA